MAAPPPLDGVAERFTLGLKEKNHRFGVGVGVGVGAALSDNARPRTNTDVSEKILRFIIQLRWSNSYQSFAHSSNAEGNVPTDVINTGLQFGDKNAWPAESCLNSF